MLLGNSIDHIQERADTASHEKHFWAQSFQAEWPKGTNGSGSPQRAVDQSVYPHNIPNQALSFLDLRNLPLLHRFSKGSCSLHFMHHTMIVKIIHILFKLASWSLLSSNIVASTISSTVMRRINWLHRPPASE